MVRGWEFNTTFLPTRGEDAKKVFKIKENMNGRKK